MRVSLTSEKDGEPLLPNSQIKKPEPKHKRKRHDLQSIRGYAILLVILFHLFPEQFSVGFTGVDIFFVLSGFLMSSIYGKSTTNVFALLRFYEKRYIRLLPLYGLTILAVIVYGVFVFTEVDYTQLFIDSNWALTLATNFKSLFDKVDYFTRVTQFKFLLHTWSLCLEMQYYFVAPVLFFFERRPNSIARLILGTIFCCSLFAHFYYQGPMSFEMLISRVWQFQCGWLASSITLPSSIFTRCLYYSSLICLVLLGIPYFSAPEKAVRVMATFSALIFIGLGKTELQGRLEKIVSPKWLVYSGDISYVWYLIHWPTIFYVKYLNIEFGVKEKFIAAAVSFGISVFAHHLIEKPLLNKRIRSMIVFLVTFALSGAILTGHIGLDVKYSKELHYRNPDCPENVAARSDYFWKDHTLIDMCASSEERVQQAVNLNMYYYPRPFYPPGCQKPKQFSRESCVLEGSGDLKILIFGNSFALRALPAIYELTKHRFKHLEMIMDSGCEPLIPPEVRTGTGECKQMRKFIVERAEELKPHVTMHIARYFSDFKFEEVKNIDEDRFYLSAKELVEQILKHSASFMISGTLEMFPRHMGDNIARRLKVGLPLHDLNHNRKTVEDYHRNTFPRIAKTCGDFEKCIFYDESRVFCDGRRICHVYDPDTLLSYYEDDQHLSFRGIEMIMPSLRSALNAALNFSNVQLLTI